MTNLVLAGALIVAALSQAQPGRKTLGIVHAHSDQDLIVVEPGNVVQVEKIPSPIQSLIPSRVAGTSQVLERGPCNMPVIRANPQVDPKIVMPIERENSDPKIRVIGPTICGQKAARTEEIVR
ncbi:MAG TPA: hypothetical protein VJ813_07115 [Vicinamibacterales bacterium]|nr:hypothetical protein [Vicinamibacterales bacterium]